MSDQAERTRARHGWPVWLSVAGIMAGLVVIAVAFGAQQSAPTPPRSVGEISRSSSPSPTDAAADTGSPTPSSGARTSKQTVATKPLGPSRPVHISIPDADVDSSVISLGLAPDGTLAVPQPGPNLNKAAWFRNSPTPGQPGPSIIEGHVDSTEGPSVFFRLAELRPGDTVKVRRADGTRLEFTVTAVRDFKKDSFPTDLVYGGENLSEPQLRLITCSDFDSSIGHHVGNAVVFAELTHIQR